LVKTIDATKHYLPETQTVLDFETAYAFFAADPQATLKIVGEKVSELLTRWNRKYSNPKAVSGAFFFSLHPFYESLFSRSGSLSH
jgi:hypothetical protein